MVATTSMGTSILGSKNLTFSIVEKGGVARKSSITPNRSDGNRHKMETVSDPKGFVYNADDDDDQDLTAGQLAQIKQKFLRSKVKQLNRNKKYDFQTPAETIKQEMK